MNKLLALFLFVAASAYGAVSVVYPGTVVAAGFVGSGSGLTNVGNAALASASSPGMITTNAFTTSQLEGQSRSVVQFEKPIWGFDTYYSSWASARPLVPSANTNIYCGPTEQFCLAVATNLVKDGWVSRAHQFGTEFWFCISDGWQGGRANGSIYANSNNFPSGLPWLVNTLHGMGLKVRLYTEVGDIAPQTTCCGKVNWGNSGGTNAGPDALTFTQWGIDGVTVDTCVDTTGDSLRKRFDHERFYGYLRTNNAAINYDIHVSPTSGQYPNGFEAWMAEFNSWQYSVEYGVGNATNAFLDSCYRIDLAAQTKAYMRNGGTPNLLIMDGPFPAFNNNLGKLMMTMWSMFQSPLVFSQDMIMYSVAASDAEYAKCATNYWCLRIDQDSRFVAPTKLFTNGLHTEGWVKPLDDGSIALALINRWPTNETLSVDLTALGAITNSTHVLLDAWFSTNYTASDTVSFSCPSNTCQLWILDPAIQSTVGAGTSKTILIQNGVPTGYVSNGIVSMVSIQDPVNAGASQLALGHGSGFEYEFGRNAGNGLLRVTGTQATQNGLEFFGGDGGTSETNYARLIPTAFAAFGIGFYNTAAPNSNSFYLAFGNSLGVTNHMLRNVANNLNDYWCDGTNVYSKTLAP